MASLQVREFPTALYEELKTRAKQEHRSVSQQTIIAIREHVLAGADTAAVSLSPSPLQTSAESSAPASYVEKRERLFAEIHAMTIPEIPAGFPSTVELLHEARGER